MLPPNLLHSLRPVTHLPALPCKTHHSIASRIYEENSLALTYFCAVCLFKSGNIFFFSTQVALQARSMQCNVWRRGGQQGAVLCSRNGGGGGGVGGFSVQQLFQTCSCGFLQRSQLPGKVNHSAAHEGLISAIGRGIKNNKPKCCH